ncbi:MAG TPA: VWA domain-containing protein [Bryobacteraceae bacterium]|nr:VWA domain-containing protein [Bryobacteraceae bacterium]
MRRFGWLLAVAACAHAESAAFRVSSDLVLVNATVLDAAGRPVTGLTAERFRLFDGGARQRIATFAEEETPVSVVLVADVSHSMRGKLAACGQAAAELARTAMPGDEFALVTFADQPRLAAGWTRDGAAVAAGLAQEQAAGTTALFDALLLAAQYAGHARNRRRVVLVVSDGGDNHSRYTAREVRWRLEESGPELYAVAIGDSGYADPYGDEGPGTAALAELCARGAGRYVTVDDASQVREAIGRISRETRSRYVLGYRPTRRIGAGRLHRVEVRVTPAAGLSRVSVSWRRGWREPE